ncbi:HECT-like ubiquitin-conjugating enzyme-binding-domain-containing protein [Russula earlei]|uniref:HECT-like ubiquitin-conjugating enzyme-binding-domain-containing protein n=1 Tax=Russula earlei TaxID=71964 RepID=A0ACC0UCM3_9AGAM|nr:HECT-like ubiquitin-conjugating enzyme-binding-domain-containing protein [Russula earlei]
MRGWDKEREGRLLSHPGQLQLRAHSSRCFMATLTKSQPVPSEEGLISSIPAPFSSAERAYILQSSHADGSRHTVTPTPATYEHPSRPQEARVSEEVILNADRIPSTTHQAQDLDVMPSITRVQDSVLTTLNDILSPFFSLTQRHPAILDRVHSVHEQSSSSQAVPPTASSPTAALRNLVTNLRHTRSFNPEMIQVIPSDNDTDLLGELSRHVGALTPSLDGQDTQLVHVLVSLLADLNRLSVLGVSPSSSFTLVGWDSGASIPNTGNFDTLARQLVEFQSQRHDQSDPEGPLPPVLAVEKALLWARIDENLETVLNLCRRREEDRPRLSPLDPPQYDLLSHDTDLPPLYDLHQESFGSDTKTLTSFPGRMSMDEKMRLDLDEVTMAIDRLYRVAPQLHNQRVELKTSKLEELESARTAQAASASAGKQKERELERIVDMIGRASDRKLVQQTVILGDMDARIERLRQRDVQRRQEFVDKLAEHSGARRIHAQDAVFSSVRPKDPDTLLTLPEFIREAVPRALQPPPDPNALLTLDEAAREHPSPPPTPGPLSLQRTKSSKGQRNRSMSAPALSWLLHASSKSENAARSIKGQSSRRSSSAGNVPSELQVSYVAEYHEGLRHILAFLNVSGVTPGVNLEASVAGIPNNTSVVESALVLRSGSIDSPALALPARTEPGIQEVRVQGLHYEIKIPTVDPPSPRAEPLPLLDAEQLRARAPTTFICASCSLPLVHGSRITRYDDLPSEHWAELVDAWMCHNDQALNAQVARHAKGFWPQSGQALVGGSYILFDTSAAVTANLRPAEKHKQGEDWRSVRCMCGALCGRCQDYIKESGETTVVFRLVKYAIRPVSPSAEPSRIPLSAFIVEDMVELARAHATYRFVILDEEEERPRILMWLFKPNMRLSYKASKNYLLPESATIQVGKVLYKILGPSMSSSDLSTLLDRYPGFPQAEQLMYPKDTCTQIALLLRESNTCYPERMRSMTRLDVGWLSRS